MRANEIILEYRYDYHTTHKKFRNKLWERMTTDDSLPEKTRTYFVDTWNTFSNQHIAGNEPLSKEHQHKIDEYVRVVIQKVEDIDPSKDQRYVRFILNVYLKFVPRLEDLYSTVAELMHKFHDLSRRGKVPAEYTDINRIKTTADWDGFRVAIREAYSQISGRELLGKGEVKDIKEFQDVTLVIPDDEEAACYYGQETEWCTATTTHINYFDHYHSSGDLYILIPKVPAYEGEKYQLHFESSSFMNEDDAEINPIALLTNRFSNDLLQYIKEKEPQITMLIPFIDEKIINRIIERIGQLCSEYVSDVMTDWEINDDYYYEWLENEGHVTLYDKDSKVLDKDDEEFDEDDVVFREVDWENAPSYGEYNPDVGDYENDVYNAFQRMTKEDIVDVGVEQAEDEGFGILDINSIETLIADVLEADGISEDVRRFVSDRVYVRLRGELPLTMDNIVISTTRKER